MIDATRALDGMQSVSMKSGLEGRNNPSKANPGGRDPGLNEVRPRRPEQFQNFTV